MNPEVIVSAAIDVIDSEGLEGLTMSRLAQVLGVRPMAVYTHFRDKDAILQSVAVELYGRFQMPEMSDDPAESLGRIARSYFRLLTENPALLRIEPIGIENPAEARLSEAMYECLLPLGLSVTDLVGLVAMLTRYVIGSAYLYPGRHT
ncbi:hypothetical protein B4U78_013300 [Microbacterium esteraromaticum]|nr:hypothetical protein B4U78_013300 [Microbacterium esteraromaticum]